MSKFRVECDCFFINEADAIAFLNLIEEIKDKTYKPTGLEPILFDNQARFHECSHEEPTSQQCGNYTNVYFNQDKVAHKDSQGKVIQYTSLDVTPKEI